jgi:hypothetical protein
LKLYAQILGADFLGRRESQFEGAYQKAYFYSAPAKKLSKPESELKAFAKTGLLQPGQSQTLSFIITAADLASFDTATSSWVAEARGVYLTMRSQNRPSSQHKPSSLVSSGRPLATCTSPAEY